MICSMLMQLIFEDLQDIEEYFLEIRGVIVKSS
jgi:hypothetical protein